MIKKNFPIFLLGFTLVMALITFLIFKALSLTFVPWYILVFAYFYLVTFVSWIVLKQSALKDSNHMYYNKFLAIKGLKMLMGGFIVLIIGFAFKNNAFEFAMCFVGNYMAFLVIEMMGTSKHAA